MVPKSQPKGRSGGLWHSALTDTKLLIVVS